jgi:hypothetical protein
MTRFEPDEDEQELSPSEFDRRLAELQSDDPATAHIAELIEAFTRMYPTV